ncbi:MAG: hypothetical protein ACRDOS_09645 [Gaiellaceae bacterium]
MEAEKDSAAAVERVIERYNDAWNWHDVDAIVAMHAPGTPARSREMGSSPSRRAPGSSGRGSTSSRSRTG